MCSDWKQFHRKHVTWKKKFDGNGYPTSFLDKGLRKVLNNLHIVKPTLATI